MGCSATRQQQALTIKEVPKDLREYVAKAEARLAKDTGVIPCERCGGPHCNWTGNHRGFCSSEHMRSWYNVHIQSVRDVDCNIFDHWDKLDADFTTQHANLANTSLPPYRKMQVRINQAMDDQAQRYQDLLKKLPADERAKLANFEELWPCGTFEELKELSVQPEEATTLRLTYATGVKCLEVLYLFTLGLARLVGADWKSVDWNIKRPMRLWRKTIDTYPDEFGKNNFRHCSDVYRTSICVDHLGQIEVLLEVLESLGRDAYDRAAVLKRLGLGKSDAHFVVERIKNRFAEPCPGGYMDVLVNLRINGYVSEIQVHLRRIRDLKGDAGRVTCKWFERYLRCEGEYFGDRAEDGSAHGRGTHYPVGGGRYDGDFFDGQRHGAGTFYFDTGDRYEGEFVDGKKQGCGTYFYLSGDRYKGGFQADKMHGRGVFYCTAGDRYEGGYHDGKRHGSGTYYYADGNKQDGEWWQNKHVDIVSL